MPDDTLTLSFLDVPVGIVCDDPHYRRLVTLNFGHCLRSGPAAVVPDYALRRGPAATHELHSGRAGLIWQACGADDDYGFLYALEKDITLHLQERRPELLFVHAGVVERGGRCLLLSAASGTGKSTLTLALQHHGFSYLSDELAPIDLPGRRVWSYPHALCLKSVPPAPYPLPPECLRTAHTLHVPADRLAVREGGPVPLGALLFLERDAARPVTRLERIGPAEAATRLYANALNALAHPGAGLDAVVPLAESLPAYRLHLGDLAAACGLVGNLPVG